MRKILYLITLVVCLAAGSVLLFFPIYKVNPDKIYELYQTEIDERVQESLAADPTLDEKTVRDGLINSRIHSLMSELFLYGNYENAILSGEMTQQEAETEVYNDIENMSKNGVKFTNLMNMLKHLKVYDQEMWKELSSNNVKTFEKIKTIIKSEFNPLPTIGFLICFLFMIAFLVLVFLKCLIGLLGNAKKKHIAWMSLVGGLFCFGIMSISKIMTIEKIAKIANPAQKANYSFLYTFESASTLYIILFCFIICFVLGFFSIFTKAEKK